MLLDLPAALARRRRSARALAWTSLESLVGGGGGGAGGGGGEGEEKIKPILCSFLVR